MQVTKDTTKKETGETVTVLISEDSIGKRLNELSQEIMRDYEGKTITLVCILKGGVMFMVDLARKLKGAVEFDFMDISSYGDSTVSSGIVKINKDLNDSITDKDVLLVEDIIDTGRSLSHLVKHLQSKGPRSLKICTLLNKPERREVHDVNPEYVGFVIPDEFVVGYGLDYNQKYRNLPFVGVLKFEE